MAVAFAALVSVFGFSSCLDSGDGTSGYDWAGYVTVKDDYLTGAHLVAENGVQLMPVSSSILAPLKLKDGSYYKRLSVAVKFLEGEILSEDKKSYKITQLVDYGLLPYKDFNLQPDTLKEDYSLVSLDGDRWREPWAANGYVNVPFKFRTSGPNLSVDDFHMYTVDAKEDTLYTRLRQTKGNNSSYDTGETFISFAIPVNSPLYYQLEPKADSIVIKITAPGDNGQTLVSTTKYKYSER